ncbi:MAG: response regulator [Zetaproteobacteria bacterium]|nr:response regulator [Zetaproteobacteria bacterium]
MKIMCVEDEESFLENLVDELSFESGTETFGFSDGFKASQALIDILPDVVITDMNMPGVHGMMMLFTVQQVLPQAQVVVLSGNSQEQSEQDYGMQINVPYFRKPVNDSFFEYVRSLKPVEHLKSTGSIEELESISKEYETWQRGCYEIAKCSLDFYDFSGDFVKKYGAKAYDNIDAARV